LGLSGFSYDSLTQSATWFLTFPIEADRVTLTLSDDVVDLAGNPLDGEWDNPLDVDDPASDAFPAGDGTPGGDFVFRFTSLPGDATRDNLVSGADYTIWADRFDNGAGPADKTFTDADFDGNGHVTGADFTIWADNFDVALPAPLPETPADQRTWRAPATILAPAPRRLSATAELVRKEAAVVRSSEPLRRGTPDAQATAVDEALLQFDLRVEDW
jgi:hypothetical protein